MIETKYSSTTTQLNMYFFLYRILVLRFLPFFFIIFSVFFTSFDLQLYFCFVCLFCLITFDLIFLFCFPLISFCLFFKFCLCFCFLLELGLVLLCFCFLLICFVYFSLFFFFFFSYRIKLKKDIIINSPCTLSIIQHTYSCNV